MKRTLLLLLCLLWVLPQAMAQKRTVNGQVKNSGTGEAIPGVSVFLKGTTSGTITDIEGKFSLEAASTDILVFQAVGLITQQVEVGNQSNFNIQMLDDIQELNEVVVTGFGIEDKLDVTGAVASVKGEDIQNVPMTSFDRLLQGRAAGVQVIAGNGQPGGLAQVRIRGTGSINAGNAPLYVIDGVIVNSGDNSQLISTSNQLSSLNPNDIESINILKDPAAASIYGAQAGNGVIIITTKRGKDGKAQINFNASVGVNSRIKDLDVLNGGQWTGLALEAWDRALAGGVVTQGAYNTAIASLGSPEGANSFDWQDAVFREAVIQNYEISVRGGSEKSRYFISASYNDTEGQAISSDFDRVAFRVNLDNQITDKLSLSTTVNIASIRQSSALDGNTFFAAPTYSSPLIIPTQVPFSDDGSYNTPLLGTFNHNILQDVTLNQLKANIVSILGSFQANYQFLPYLNYRATINVDFNHLFETDFRDASTIDGSAFDGLIGESTRNRTNIQTDHTLNFAKTFADKHQVSALAGFQYREDEQRDIFAYGQTFNTPLLQSIDNTAEPNSISGDRTKFIIASFLAKLGYIFDNRYIVNFTVRRDGSSRFGRDNRWGTFPAVSVAWRLSNEGFMGGISFIDNLKLRASWGQTGNSEIGNFASLGLFGLNTYNGRPSITTGQVPNSNLGWEINETVNIGLDYSFLKGRVNGAIDVYQRDTKDLLLNRPLPRTSGFASVTANVGQLRNTGIELEISTTNLVVGDFTWTTNFNVAFQDSKVVNLGDTQSDTLVLANAGGTYIVGQEARAFYHQAYAGVNPADGRPMWYDEFGEISYFNNSGNTRSIRGSANPDNFGGINNSFSWKGIQLDILFQWQVGNLIQWGAGISLQDPGSVLDNNLSSNILSDRWTTPGQLADIPATTVNNNYANGGERGSGANSTRFVYKGDYLRLKTISLSYDLPASIMQKLKMRSIQIYAQGVNLLTFTDYPGYDPEVLGNDFGDFPQGRMFTFGINVGL